MERAEKFNTFLKPKRGVDVAPATMHQRMTKSEAEIALIKHGANVADVGGYAIREAIAVGATELEV
jgi:creatinase